MCDWLDKLMHGATVVDVLAVIVSLWSLWKADRAEHRSVAIALLSQRIRLREVLHGLIDTLEHAERAIKNLCKIEDVVDFARAWFIEIEKSGVVPRLCGCEKNIFRAKHEFVMRVCGILRQTQYCISDGDVRIKSDMLSDLMEKLEYYATECTCHPDTLESSGIRPTDIGAINQSVSDILYDWDAIEHVLDSDITI